MFHFLGRAVARFWPLMLVFWILVLAGVRYVAPTWDDVVQDGEFSYLPDDLPSREAETVFRDAFSNDMLGSSVVLVVHRKDGLYETDQTFIDTVLRPRIELIQPLTDISRAVTPDDRDAEQTYAEINQLLNTVWQQTEDPWPAKPKKLGEDELSPAESVEKAPPDAEAIEEERQRLKKEQQRLKSITEVTGAVANAVRDWHFDLFPPADESETDPDPETGRSTGLTQRIANQLNHLEVPVESWKETFQQQLSPAAENQWIAPSGPLEKADSIIQRVRCFSDKSIGRLLESKDHKASLVRVELSTEFLIKDNREFIRKIETLVGGNEAGELGALHSELLRPPGLDLALSGSATVGRDMKVNAEKSASDTHTWTLILLIALLLVIYRAPVLVIIPLATVAVSVRLSLLLLSMLAEAGYVGLFSGIETYSVVVMYGAGIDYCMFLIARYKEELDAGATFDEATSQSITKVGAALAASAGTTMCGIGMMVFADFGKFREAGVAMSFGLIFVLLASLTFAPAMLRLFGRWAFWPHIRTERISVASGWISPTSLIARMLRRQWFAGVWDRVGRLLLAKPGTVWLATVAAMLPFVAIAIMFFGNLSYGLLSELPSGEASVVGADVVKDHFPAGQTGPITVLIENQRVDFLESDGRDAIKELTDRLEARKDELQISDIRSIAHPLGLQADKDLAKLKPIPRAIQKRSMRERGLKHYVSDKGDLAGHVTRIDIIVKSDPFSRESIDQFERLESAFKPPTSADEAAGESKTQSLLPVELTANNDTAVYFIGATPSIRDLKTVTGTDQIRIDVLVIAVVFFILVLLLRKVAISGYLIASVFFSYLVTLGFTFAVFWAIDPAGFAGLDWKVPMFLFTILIAVGEDYNIYLMTRIDEEQLQHGQVEGVTVALSKTGKIISSCGLIMAGTFASLAIGGSLAAMRQLGFALAAGVLLDTFVVRPILVPAYLILLYRGRFGFLGRFLGAGKIETVDAERSEPTVTTESDAGFSSRAG
ncbi:MAG: MMPL family transporter [Planctomycetaceae bacterium]|jgi:putative drug exporter of the RND superfamily|nr:MMPL family transporter [Planctomycetaceae bacterium]MBT6497917.1 MMPL family transporter [Planctomycetaceae bacterium]